MSKDKQRLKIFKIAQECKGSPTRISHALIDAGFRDVGELRNWLKGEKNKWKEEWDGYNNLVQNPYQEILNKLESL
jgi:hypothetical protein